MGGELEVTLGREEYPAGMGGAVVFMAVEFAELDAGGVGVCGSGEVEFFAGKDGTEDVEFVGLAGELATGTVAFIMELLGVSTVEFDKVEFEKGGDMAGTVVFKLVEFEGG